MSDDYLETLWTQLKIEWLEHIEAIELLLVEAGDRTLERTEVDSLFRSFHSLKGMSKAMDLVGMETIAHHCEDILGLAREGAIKISDQIVPLLCAVDGLSRHLNHAIEHRSDMEPVALIIEDLKKAASAASSGGAVAVASSAETEQAPETPEQEIGLTKTLKKDPDLLKFFAEMIAEKLPLYLQTLFTDCPEGESQPAEEAATLSKCYEIIDEIIFATESIELSDFKMVLDHLRFQTEDFRKHLPDADAGFYIGLEQAFRCIIILDEDNGVPFDEGVKVTVLDAIRCLVGSSYFTKEGHKALEELDEILDEQRQTFEKLNSLKQVASARAIKPAAEGERPEPSEGGHGNIKSQKSLRVSGETLDQFMSQIGEMVSIRGMLNHAIQAEEILPVLNGFRQLVEDRADAIGGESEQMLEHIELILSKFSKVRQVDQKLHGVLGQLQDSALALRVVPMETVFKRFPRVVRDTSRALGKRVKLHLSGQEVRIDKAMVEVLNDPLMHMIRNSVDHGIESPHERSEKGKPETARVELAASQRGNWAIVQVIDDGKGLDVERIAAKAVANGLVCEEELERYSKDQILNFIFQPGFSTAEVVTETSGRGVGMDVVRDSIVKLGGDITIESELGLGTTFSLRLPLSAAIQETLLVNTSGQTMAIPERYVSELIEVKASDLQSCKGNEAVFLRNSFLPIYHLGPLLGFKEMDEELEDMVVIIISDGKHRIGLIVDRSYQRQELFIKDIHEQLTQLPGVGGASILGDGRVVLILDVEDLFKLALKLGSKHRSSKSESEVVSITPQSQSMDDRVA